MRSHAYISTYSPMADSGPVASQTRNGCCQVESSIDWRRAAALEETSRKRLIAGFFMR